MAEPAAKKAKIEEAVKADAAAEPEKKDEEMAQEPEKPKEPEVPVEKEEDAKADKSAKIKDAIAFHTQDTTMNVMQSTYGNILMPLTDGGMQFLLAGARGNTGVKSGRYSFEVKLVELISHAEDPAARQRAPMPRSQLRVGFATEGSSLFLGDSEDSVCFDTEGFLIHNNKKTAASKKFAPDEVVTVLLNLDKSSPNANTISLFKDGERICQPQELPASLQGKTLYPAVTFKNVTVHYNFGPTPMKALPFKCRMLGEASTKDANVIATPKDAKEVIFPVCLPDEGTFDWLDLFLEKNPQYTELSDRAMLAWAEKSGISRPKGYGANSKSSNDKPEMNFGIGLMDDNSIRRVIQAVAPIQNRSYIVMEVKSNLLAEGRKELLSKWSASSHKTIAAVVMGEVPAAFKKRTQELTLSLKQQASDAEFKAKLEEAKRKKEHEKKQKQLEKDRKTALQKQKKQMQEMKKKMAIEKKKREATAKGEEYNPDEDEEIKKMFEEEKEDEEEEKEEVEEDEEPMDEEPPKVELTAEEKKLAFRQNQTPDLNSYSLSTNFTKFSLPEKAEGFAEIRYDWSKADKSKEYIKEWIQEKKTTTRIEDLQPGEWFQSKYPEWQKTLQAWRAKSNSWTASLSKKAAEKVAKQAKKAAKAAAKEAKAKAAAAKKEAAEKAAAEGGEKKDEDAPMEDPEPEESEDEPEEEEETQTKVDHDKLDLFGLESVTDIGGGEPLFSSFGFEDWQLMNLRIELHFLAHAFRMDVKDPDRMGITTEHLAFYYQKYFKKILNSKSFGYDTTEEMLQLVRETVHITKKNKVLESLLPEDMETFSIFAMLTEEARRERNRRVDLGDETAKLKFSAPNQGGHQGGYPGGPQVVAAGGFAAAGGARPALPPQAMPRPVIAPQVRPAGGAWPQTPPRPVAAGVLRPAGSWRPVQPAWRG